MTPAQLLKAVAAVTGVTVYGIRKRQLHSTLRCASDARMLTVLAAATLWPQLPKGRLGKCVGLRHSGSIQSFNRGNARFRSDPEFAAKARQLFALIQPHVSLPKQTTD